MLSITELSEKSLPEAIQNVITNSPTVELELIEWISEFWRFVLDVRDVQ